MIYEEDCNNCYYAIECQQYKMMMKNLHYMKANAAGELATANCKLRLASWRSLEADQKLERTKRKIEQADAELSATNLKLAYSKAELDCINKEIDCVNRELSYAKLELQEVQKKLSAFNDLVKYNCQTNDLLSSIVQQHVKIGDCMYNMLTYVQQNVT